MRHASPFFCGAPARLPLGGRTSDELVNLLRHPNDWYVREARRILMERRDLAVCPRLAKMVQREKGRLALEALWALHVSGGLDDERAMKFLDHPFEHVRAWTVRLLGDRRRVDRRFNARLVELAKRESSVIVRSQLACTCKRLPGPVALPVVEQLLGRSEDVADPHIARRESCRRRSPSSSCSSWREPNRLGRRTHPRPTTRGSRRCPTS